MFLIVAAATWLLAAVSTPADGHDQHAPPAFGWNNTSRSIQSVEGAGESLYDSNKLAAFSGYTLHEGVDITGANDGAFGGLCQNAAFFGAASTNLWKEPSSVCDLVGCPRFGLRAGAKSEAGPYCIKGWVKNASVNSYLSQTTCGVSKNGSVVAAKIVAGSCNDPDARYTVCPDGGGDTMPLETVSGPAAAIEKACTATRKCVGFLARVDGTGGTLLQYGYSGNFYTGFTTYTRIPKEQVVPEHWESESGGLHKQQSAGLQIIA